MEAPHGYVRLLATKQGLGYLHPHTLPFDFVLDEIAHNFTDEYEDDENDIDDLTVVDHKMAANQPRVPAGSSAGGQFGSTSGSGAANGSGAQPTGAYPLAEQGALPLASGAAWNDLNNQQQRLLERAAQGQSIDGLIDRDALTELNQIANDPAFLLNSPQTVYFGVAGQKLSSLEPGDTFQSLGTRSTTQDAGRAQRYRGEQGAVLRVELPVGTRAMQYEVMGVKETTLLPGSQFKITATIGGIKQAVLVSDGTQYIKNLFAFRVKIDAAVTSSRVTKSNLANDDESKMAANQPRVPAGSSAGGQFGSTAGGGADVGAGGGAGKQTDTAEFKAWFGDSKVVDADGNPMVVFHGTHKAIGATESPEDKSGIFFSSDADVANAYAVRFGNSLDGGEAYDKLRAKLIAQGVNKNEVQTTPEWQALEAITRIEGSQVAPVYLKISNPLLLDGNKAADAATANRIKDSPAEHALLKAQGYDGIIIHNVIDRPVIAYTAADAQLANKKASVFVVFSTTQIKSSIGNSGAFDPTSRDITKMAANQPRVPAGSSAGGQFGSTSGSGTGGGATQTDTVKFKAWFGDSKVVDSDGKPLVVYHGGGPNEGFDHEFIGASTLMGPGFYFTSDADQANSYAVGFQRGGAVKPVFVSVKNPMIVDTDVSGHPQDSKITRHLPASTIESLILSSPAANPRGYQSSLQQARTNQKVKDSITELSNVSEHKAFMAIGKEFYGQGFDDSANHFGEYLTKFEAATGYDGIITGTMKRGPASLVLPPKIVVVAFQPQQIKSSIGNSGAFDPTSRDITKMAANQPRVPAGSSAGGQFGSTGNGAGGEGAEGGTAVTSASESPPSASGVTTFADLKARYEAKAQEVPNPGIFGDTYKQPITVTDLTLEVYRVGSAADTPRGIFFASDRAGADAYQSLHEGNVTKKYMVTVDKVLVAGHQNTVTKFLFKKTYQDLQYEMQRKYGSATAGNTAFDKKIMAAAKKLGFKAIVYTRPAPPAEMELHLFSSKGLLEIKMAVNQPRVPAGSSAGGQFGSTGGGGAGNDTRQSGVAGAEVRLMHGTTYGSALTILKEGFLPGEGGRVYATPNEDIAVEYGFGKLVLEEYNTNYEDPNAKFAVVHLQPNIQGFRIDNPSPSTDTWQWTRRGPVLPSEILRVDVYSAWDRTKPVQILLPSSLPANKQTPAIQKLYAVVMFGNNGLKYKVHRIINHPGSEDLPVVKIIQIN